MASKWLSYSQIKSDLKGVKPKLFITCIDEVYQQVGRFIDLSQNWESNIKKYMGEYNISNETTSIKGIGDLIAHLGNKHIFDIKQIIILRKAVKFRNYVTHHLFNDFVNKVIDFKTIDRILTKAIKIINDSNNIINKNIQRA